MTLFQQFLLPVFCLSCSLVAGCGGLDSGIPARGELAGQAIDTTVDSEAAKYYLEHYLQNDHIDPALDALIDAVHAHGDDALPTQEELKSLTERFSTDFATLYLASRILENPSNRALQAAYRKEILDVEATMAAAPTLPQASSYVVLFVPGWFYRSAPETGADFARQREVLGRLGLENYLVEIDENGTVEANAILIADEIRRFSRSHKKIILVSASKAGPEVAYAVGGLLDDEQARGVEAWLNIGGIVQGSTLADLMLRWPNCWLVDAYFAIKGQDTASMAGITTPRSRERFSQLVFPDHLLIVNVLGIPLSGDVTRRARFGYSNLRGEGPNDGLMLITDGIVPQGVTLIEFGLDHFLADRELDVKTAALARAVLKQLVSSAHIVHHPIRESDPKRSAARRG